jgi:hypothetical protein
MRTLIILLACLSLSCKSYSLAASDRWCQRRKPVSPPVVSPNPNPSPDTQAALEAALKRLAELEAQYASLKESHERAVHSWQQHTEELEAQLNRLQTNPPTPGTGLRLLPPSMALIRALAGWVGVGTGASLPPLAVLWAAVRVIRGLRGRTATRKRVSAATEGLPPAAHLVTRTAVVEHQLPPGPQVETLRHEFVPTREPNGDYKSIMESLKMFGSEHPRNAAIVTQIERRAELIKSGLETPKTE